LLYYFLLELDGLTEVNVSVADAYISDVSSDKNRSKNFGKMAISSNLGFIVGPALAGILGATVYGETLPVLAALFLSLVTLAVMNLALREPKPFAVLEVSKKKEKVLEKSLHWNTRSVTSIQIPRNLNSMMFLALNLFRICSYCIF